MRYLAFCDTIVVRLLNKPQKITSVAKNFILLKIDPRVGFKKINVKIFVISSKMTVLDFWSATLIGSKSHFKNPKSWQKFNIYFVNATLGSILNKINFLTTDMIFLTLLSNGTNMVPQKAKYLKRGGLDYFYFLIC